LRTSARKQIQETTVFNRITDPVLVSFHTNVRMTAPVNDKLQIVRVHEFVPLAIQRALTTAVFQA